MRFWLLTTEYPPSSGGGISTYCAHTAAMLAENGVEVTVFIPAHQSKPRRVVHQREGIRLVYFKGDGNPQNKFLGWEAALSYEFSRVLREFQDDEGCPDFIESQEYGGIAYYALQRRLLEETYLANCVFYVTAHSPGFLYLDYNQAPCYQFPEYWTGEMEKSVLVSADFILSPSEYLLQELGTRVDLHRVQTLVLRNPFRAFKLQSDYVQGDLVFFGKLIPQKGGLQMLEIFAKMWDEGFMQKLRIIGGGAHYFYPKLMDMGDYVRKHFRKYIDKGLLIFEGHLEPPEWPDRLSRAHVVIIPSIVDNLPYTALEAMSMGKIVLASRQGGHAELIEHGRNGFLFSHTNHGEFQAVLTSILDLSRDRVLEIGRAANETIISECSYQTVFSAKLDAINRLKAKRRKEEFPFIRPRGIRCSVPSRNPERDLLTVVIPFHNLGSCVIECVKSVLASTYENREVIVVDDGSTDAPSIDALRAVSKMSPVRVIHQKNKGLCVTRNEAARDARGEYLAFLDADDTVQPKYYVRAIRILRAYENVSFVGCWAQYFGRNDEVWPSFNPEPPYLLTHNSINSSALVYKTAHFLAAGENDPAMIYGMEDYDSIINMVSNGLQGVVLPDILWNYRIRRDSMSQSFNRYSELYLYRLISQKHGEFYSEYAADVVNLLNANGPGMNYKNPTFPSTPHGRFISLLDAAVGKLIKGNKILRKIALKIDRTLFSRA